MLKFIHRYVIHLFLVSLLNIGLVKGQSVVWPGDVNNNGAVNIYDVLYWSLASAAEATGTARIDNSIDWAGIEINDADLWDDEFPSGGPNYIYADCNGDGKVDSFDLKVIERNFGFENPPVRPEQLIKGDSILDPILSLVNTEVIDTVQLGNPITLTVDLAARNLNNEGTAKFWAIGFVITFEPEYILDRPDGKDSIFYIFDWENTFLASTAEDESTFFALQHPIPNRENEFHVVVYRTSEEFPVMAQSLGSLGKVRSIVVEQDISLGKSSTFFDISQIVLINEDLEQIPVSKGEEKVIGILELILGTDYRERLGDASEVNVFPMPVRDEVTAQFKRSNSLVNAYQLIDLNGRVLEYKDEISAPQVTINTRNLELGQYYLIIHRDDIIYIKTILKQ